MKYENFKEEKNGWVGTFGPIFLKGDLEGKELETHSEVLSSEIYLSLEKHKEAMPGNVFEIEAILDDFYHVVDDDGDDPVGKFDVAIMSLYDYGDSHKVIIETKLV